MLTSKDITRALPEYRRVVELMSAAFPADEQLPVWFLLWMSRRKGIEFQAYYDADRFVGFSFVVASYDTAFLLFIAVEPQARSAGYGSQILGLVKSAFPGRPVCLDMERVDSSAENYEQRLRCLAFYEKNGFRDTGHLMGRGKSALSILSNAAEFDATACAKTLGRLTFGLVVPRFTRAEG